MKFLAAALAAAAALALCNTAQAARYQFTLEGGAYLGFNFCWELGYCEPSPRLPPNSKFAASFTIDDAHLVWDPDGFSWWYAGEISNFSIQLGGYTLSKSTVAFPVTLGASAYPGEDPDGVIYFDGTATASWSDQPLNWLYDGYLAYAFEPHTLAVNTTAQGGTTRLRIGRMDIYNLTLEHLVVSAVPEPSTWALMITGVGLAGAGLRRSRAQRQAPLRLQQAS